MLNTSNTSNASLQLVSLGFSPEFADSVIDGEVSTPQTLLMEAANPLCSPADAVSCIARALVSGFKAGATFVIQKPDDTLGTYTILVYESDARSESDLGGLLRVRFRDTGPVYLDPFCFKATEVSRLLRGQSVSRRPVEMAVGHSTLVRDLVLASRIDF